MKLIQLNEPQLELVNHEADDLGVSDVAGTVPTEVRSGTAELLTVNWGRDGARKLSAGWNTSQLEKKEESSSQEFSESQAQ